MSGTKINYFRPGSCHLDLPRKGSYGYTMTITKPKLNGTHLIHGDSIHPVSGGEVAPSISVTTSAFIRVRGKKEPVVHVLLAFRAPSGSLAEADGIDIRNPSRHVYSRYTQQVSTRAEHILSRINVMSKIHFPRILRLTDDDDSPGWFCSYLFFWSGCLLRCTYHNDSQGLDVNFPHRPLSSIDQKELPSEAVITGLMLPLQYIRLKQ